MGSLWNSTNGCIRYVHSTPSRTPMYNQQKGVKRLESLKTRRRASISGSRSPPLKRYLQQLATRKQLRPATNGQRESHSEPIDKAETGSDSPEFAPAGNRGFHGSTAVSEAPHAPLRLRGLRTSLAPAAQQLPCRQRRLSHLLATTGVHRRRNYTTEPAALLRDVENPHRLTAHSAGYQTVMMYILIQLIISLEGTGQTAVGHFEQSRSTGVTLQHYSTNWRHRFLCERMHQL